MNVAIATKRTKNHRAMMIAFPALCGLAILALASGTAHAVQADFSVHGSVCQPTPGGAGVAGYSAFNGVFNNTTSNNAADGLTVTCPIPVPRLFFLQEVNLIVSDRHPSLNFQNCVLRFIDLNANQQFSPVNYASQNINQTPSFLMNSGLLSLNGVNSMAVECTIPPVSAGSLSFIHAIRVRGTL